MAMDVMSERKHGVGAVTLHIPHAQIAREGLLLRLLSAMSKEGLLSIG